MKISVNIIYNNYMSNIYYTIIVKNLISMGWIKPKIGNKLLNSSVVIKKKK